jgi:hypothetical protein
MGVETEAFRLRHDPVETVTIDDLHVVGPALKRTGER